MRGEINPPAEQPHSVLMSLSPTPVLQENYSGIMQGPKLAGKISAAAWGLQTAGISAFFPQITLGSPVGSS